MSGAKERNFRIPAARGFGDVRLAGDTYTIIYISTKFTTNLFGERLWELKAVGLMQNKSGIHLCLTDLPGDVLKKLEERAKKWVREHFGVEGKYLTVEITVDTIVIQEVYRQRVRSRLYQQGYRP